MGIFMRQLLKWGVKPAGCSSAPVFNFSVEVVPYCMIILTVMSLSDFFPVGPALCFDLEMKVALCSRERSLSPGLVNSRWYLSAGGISVGSGRGPLFQQDFHNSASLLGKTWLYKYNILLYQFCCQITETWKVYKHSSYLTLQIHIRVLYT